MSLIRILVLGASLADARIACRDLGLSTSHARTVRGVGRRGDVAELVYVTPSAAGNLPEPVRYDLAALAARGARIVTDLPVSPRVRAS